MLSKSKLYMVGYSAFSLTSFGASFIYSGSKSYDFLTLMQELTDGGRLVVFLNFIVFCFLFGGLSSTKLLFGNVRLMEIERIADKLPFYALNLLFILFNDDNLILNVTWTGLTLLSKIHHLITFDRVEMLQVNAVNTLSQHSCTRGTIIKMFASNLYMALLVVLLVVDILLARILAYDIFQGVSSMGSLLFGIQFGVLGIESFTFLSKMLLNAYELAFYRCVDSSAAAAATTPEHNADDDDDEDEDDDDMQQQIWENRPLYTQGLDITSSALESIFYSVFLYMLYFHSRLSPPINIIQAFASSIYQVIKKGNSLSRYLNQSRHLENQLKNPSESELEASDHLCIICREDMHFPQKFLQERGKPLNSRKHPKKMSCGHILHLSCLMDWLEMSDSCPMCRKVVFTGQNQPASFPASAEAIPQPQPGARPFAPTQTFEPINTNTARNFPDIGATLHFEDELVQDSDASSAPSISQLPVSNEQAEYSDWLSIPITPGINESEYNISLSPNHQGILRVKRSTRFYPGRLEED